MFKKALIINVESVKQRIIENYEMQQEIMISSELIKLFKNKQTSIQRD